MSNKTIECAIFNVSHVNTCMKRRWLSRTCIEYLTSNNLLDATYAEDYPRNLRYA